MDELTSTFALWKARRSAQNASSQTAPVADTSNVDTKQVSTENHPDPPVDILERTVTDVVNIAATSITSAVRRSTEIGLAMQAKGSTKAPTTASSWGVPDLVAAVVTLVTVAAVFVLDP